LADASESAASERERNYPYYDAPRLPEGGDVDPRALLHTEQPVELEIGPGRGRFLLERLASDPAVHIFGLEIRRKWATLVDRQISERGDAARARVFAEDAGLALARLVSASLFRIYVHFPDPWWKKRHRKRLVMQPSLVEQSARLLVPGGDFFIQTDVEERAASYQRLLESHPAFQPGPDGPRVGDPNFGARSAREHRALLDQLPIIRLRFFRRW
jgi:tRNA (guanine-N7-)-methyltransferase